MKGERVRARESREKEVERDRAKEIEEKRGRADEADGEQDRAR